MVVTQDAPKETTNRSNRRPILVETVTRPVFLRRTSLLTGAKCRIHLPKQDDGLLQLPEAARCGVGRRVSLKVLGHDAIELVKFSCHPDLRVDVYVNNGSSNRRRMARAKYHPWASGPVGTHSSSGKGDAHERYNDCILAARLDNTSSRNTMTVASCRRTGL